MTGSLGNHMGQRRLDGLNFIHHHVFDLANRVPLHITQRRMEKTVRQTEPEALQNRVGHAVGDACGQAEKQDFSHIGSQGSQAPVSDSSLRHGPRHKKADEPVHAVKGCQPQHDAQH